MSPPPPPPVTGPPRWPRVPKLPPKVRDKLRAADERASLYLVTPVVKWLTYTCVIIFIARIFLALPFWVNLFGASVSGTILHARLWQLLTYAVIHADLGNGGLFHVLFNILGLWFFGTRLELTWGPTRFARLIVATAIGSAATHLTITTLFVGLHLLDPIALSVPIIGLSGVVYGLLLVYAIQHPRDTVLVYGIFPIRVLTLAWILGIMAFLGSVGYGSGNVAHLGHLGGLLFGWLFLKYPKIFDRIPMPRVGHRKWRPPARTR